MARRHASGRRERAGLRGAVVYDGLFFDDARAKEKIAPASSIRLG